MSEAELLLDVRDLCTVFHGEEGTARAVDGVSFRIHAGETLGLVGESGCGKSVTALSILRLIPDPPGEITGGEVRFDGHDLLALPEREMRAIRGDEIAMIFQEPTTALNPVFTVGEQIMEVVRLHQGLDKSAAARRAVQMLERVGIPSPEERVGEYPHQLSGGMRQRVMIAMAMSCDPRLLIADEPTTALDVTVQAQILELIDQLQERSGMSVLLITHDLGVVAERADAVAVMYAGKVVEYADVLALYDAPRHPYTVGLFASLPDLTRPDRRLPAIPGSVPDPFHFPSGCRYRPRCPRADERCATEEPPLVELGAGDSLHRVACHHPVDDPEPSPGEARDA